MTLQEAISEHPWDNDDFRTWVDGALRTNSYICHDSKSRYRTLIDIECRIAELVGEGEDKRHCSYLGHRPNYSSKKVEAQIQILAEAHLVKAEARAGKINPLELGAGAFAGSSATPSNKSGVVYATSKNVAQAQQNFKPVVARSVLGPAVNTNPRVIPPGCEYIYEDLQKQIANVVRFPLFGFFYAWLDRLRTKRIEELCANAVRKTQAEQNYTDTIHAGTVQEGTRAVQVAGLANSVAAANSATANSEASATITSVKSEAVVNAYERAGHFGLGALPASSPQSLSITHSDLGIPTLDAKQKEKKEAELAHLAAEYGHEPSPDNEMAFRDGVVDTIGEHPFEVNEIGEGTHGMLKNLANSGQDSHDLDVIDDSESVEGKS